MAKKHLLISEPPLQVLPSLAKTIGLNEAITLQQLHYWLENPKAGVDREGFRWVYNTYEDWQRDNFPFWSTKTIQRTFLNLERDGLVVSAQLDASRHDQKKYYRIDYDKVNSLIVTDCPHPARQGDCPDSDKESPCLNESETTTETTQRRGKSKFSNPVWDLQHGQNPDLSEEDIEVIQLEQAYKTIAEKLETGLRRGEFPQTPKAQAVYRWILKKEISGQSLERFIQWAMRDERAVDASWIYHDDLDRIKRDWLQAFPAANSTPDGKRASSFYG